MATSSVDPLTGASSPLSFQGLSTGLQTDALVSAIMDQASLPLVRLQQKQSQNTQRSSLLRTIKADLLALNTSIGSLNTSSVSTQTVSSSDSSNTYVTATANGATTGNYDVIVEQLAKKARLVVPQAVSSATASLGGVAESSGADSGLYEYSITGTDGKTTTLKLSAANNTLNGLKDAINQTSSTTGVSASVVQKDAAGTQFELVLSATASGLGTGGGNTLSLAQAGANAGSQLFAGHAAAYVSAASEQAQNATFIVNGVEMSRSSNTITDAVAGVTFTLKADGQTSSSAPTTLTVATDKTAITKGLQDVVDKFNAVLKIYKDNSGQDSSGNPQLLANDFSLRTLISQVRSALTSVPSGLSSSNYYQSTVELGLKTGRDGTMSLDTTALQSALDANPSAVANVFSTAGSSVQNLVNSITSPGSGNIAQILQGIDNQNSNLNLQISTMQATLNRKRQDLQNQYANLESVIGQLQAAGQSISSLK